MNYGNWVPISKAFSDSLPKNRKFSELEAMYSLQLDHDNNVPVTVSGCAGRWDWSRDKVRKFLADTWVTIEYEKDTKSFKKQKGKLKKTLNQHEIDIKPTLKKHKRFIDKNDLEEVKNMKSTLKKQQKNINHYTTIKPNPNPNPKEESIPQNEFAGDNQEEFYLTKKKRKLKGKRLITFNRFWKSFGYKKGKADAADSWYDIPQLTDGLVNEICEAAKVEANIRGKLISEGRTPIFPQGWLTARRWEDESEFIKNKDSGREKAQREIERTQKLING